MNSLLEESCVFGGWGLKSKGQAAVTHRGSSPGEMELTDQGVGPLEVIS